MRPTFNLGLLLFLFLGLSCQVNGQNGIRFHNGTWAEALERASADNKIIFVDAYTTWCGPCIQMSKQVFTDATVGEFFNKNFVNVKLDMEKGEGKDFAKKYQVMMYPTLIFVDSQGNVVSKTIGKKNADELIAIGKKALANR